MSGYDLSVRDSLLLIVLLIGSAGCVTTTSLTPPAELHTLREPPTRLLVQVAGDSVWRTVIQYRTTPDSIYGSLEGSSLPGTPLRRLEVPFDSITAVRLQRRDVARTAAVPVVSGVLLAMTAWILASP